MGEKGAAITAGDTTSVRHIQYGLNVPLSVSRAGETRGISLEFLNHALKIGSLLIGR